MVEVSELTKKYGEVLAVDGVSFQVFKGELFGFLGPNGAGKSTTIKILATLARPTSGSARLNGYDVTSRPDEVRRCIGLVFQDPSLDERLTAEENLHFHAVLYGVDPRDLRRRMAEVLELVELKDRARSLVRTFSGGMRRRLEIARGLLHYPAVLFLDEPTIGLDPQTRNRIWEYILELRRREGLTIFMTTHYMDEAEICDRIAIIDHGRIVALDTPSNLKRLVGGDVLTLHTQEGDGLAAEIEERFGCPVTRSENELQLEVTDAATFLPGLLGHFGGRVKAINLRRPTLDDVFLKLTGRAIREEEASSTEHLRALARAWRRNR